MKEPSMTRAEIEKFIAPYLIDLPVEKYPLIAFGIRGIYGENKRGVWDDANGFIERTPAGIFAIFPGNTDPTAPYRKGLGSLSSGQILWFKIGLHRGRQAFRQAAPFLVDRDGIGKRLPAPISCAFNWHDSLSNTTSSLGCQTNPKDVFKVVRELGYMLVRRHYPKTETFPYILVDGSRAAALKLIHEEAKAGDIRYLCQEAVELVKSFEGFRPKPYLCPAGKWSLGFGHTHGVTANTPPVTREQAVKLLEDDLAEFGKGVSKLLDVPTKFNEFGALVSLAYNIGLGNFGSSTLLKKVNARDFFGAADQFLVWNKARNPKTKKLEVLAGLTKRREAERRLFLG